ncbi:MAG: esterase family protein, partial [Chitinophagaceae bacterium]
MKRFAGVLFLSFLINLASAQGRVEEKTFLAASLQNNKGGEDPNRKLFVYLPPGYDNSTQRYPTLYFLHGFAADASDMMQWIDFKTLMDSAISSGKMRPMILVLPSSMTTYFGSFYTNSSLTGNWADYIGKDVVAYMDKAYRTLAHRSHRGLFGHSMGGNGALKLAMLYASTFSAVYAMSPGALHFSDEFRLSHPAFKRVYQQKTLDSLRTAAPPLDFERFPFFEMLYVSMARTYSPNVAEKKMQADGPIQYVGDKMVVNAEVLKKWEANFPINMIENHLEALRSLTALKIDWGRNEDFRHIPATNLQFSKKLEAFGIKHFAEEYIGDHVNMLEGFEGR